MFPIHWGVFRLSREPMHEPPIRLQREARLRGLGQQVAVLQPGEQIGLD
jgi:N-acyl-phosphatidylethanolamine-hydrolysing phospholipase D